MAELSMDRKEFARLCAVEIMRAAKLSGGKMPDADFILEISLDMAASQALSRVPNGRVQELFACARANYAEAPLLRHLVKAWEHHLRPKADAPAPNDAPRLPAPPSLAHSEAQMRKLAAIRTALAIGGISGIMAGFGELDRSGEFSKSMEPEEWMGPLLDLNPSRGEVEANMRASKPSMEWYRRNPDIPPCWGAWMDHYGL